ncbi:MAG: RAD55 family ATPase [Candidatus Bathyarchaeia archaeon]
MERVKSGIKGLDELLEGGFPKGRCILLVGGPGSGKTIFALQFLAAGAEEGEPGLYVSLDEKPEEVKEEMSSLGWNLEGLEREGKLFFIDATPLKKVEPDRSVPSSYKGLEFRLPTVTLENIIETAPGLVSEEGIRRMAVDPITALTLRYSDHAERRRAILNFFDSLSQIGCTSIITSELRATQLDRGFQPEEFLAHGVIVLHTIIHEGVLIKAIQIEKMRGIKHDLQLRPYKITDKGIEVFPKDRIF